MHYDQYELSTPKQPATLVEAPKPHVKCCKCNKPLSVSGWMLDAIDVMEARFWCAECWCKYLHSGRKDR